MSTSMIFVLALLPVPFIYFAYRVTLFIKIFTKDTNPILNKTAMIFNKHVITSKAGSHKHVEMSDYSSDFKSLHNLLKDLDYDSYTFMRKFLPFEVNHKLELFYISAKNIVMDLAIYEVYYNNALNYEALNVARYNNTGFIEISGKLFKGVTYMQSIAKVLNPMLNKLNNDVTIITILSTITYYIGMLLLNHYI